MADPLLNRREFLGASTALATGAVTGGAFGALSVAQDDVPRVQTVLGPVSPDHLGATLMHEHAPVVDWSELYETPAAPLEPLREHMLEVSARQLKAFHDVLPEQVGETGDSPLSANAGGAREIARQRGTVPLFTGPGAIVECTPIRVGRYPRLLVELARRVPVHVIACTGFWCETMAPQHPWALRLGLVHGGVRQMAELFIREVREGMEDPGGPWGERFTEIRAGMIKVATSTYLRPSERRVHEAAAIASKEIDCPITTHTTDGGGLEQAQLLIQLGVTPERIAIGHQGHRDDREHDEAYMTHRQIAELGCYVQFDRVGHENYSPEKIARLISRLSEAGHAERVLVGHDHVPFVYRKFAQSEKPLDGWQQRPADFTIAPTKLAAAMREQGIAPEVIRTILVENPKRLLAFAAG